MKFDNLDYNGIEQAIQNINSDFEKDCLKIMVTYTIYLTACFLLKNFQMKNLIFKNPREV